MWQYDVIPILVHLLRDLVEEVQANAAGALMYATVTTEGEATGGLGMQVGGIPCVGTGANVSGRRSLQPPSTLAALGSFPGLLISPLPALPKYIGLLLKSFPVWVLGSAGPLLPGHGHSVTGIRITDPSLQATPWAWHFCLCPRPLVSHDSGVD